MIRKQSTNNKVPALGDSYGHVETLTDSFDGVHERWHVPTSQFRSIRYQRVNQRRSQGPPSAMPRYGMSFQLAAPALPNDICQNSNKNVSLT